MRKVYGESKLESCPFCGKQALSKNMQGIPVCINHKNSEVMLKCVCGKPLDIMEGKYGPFGNCIDCGNISLRKALEINPIEIPKKEEARNERKVYTNAKTGSQNIVIRSDDPNYFD